MKIKLFEIRDRGTYIPAIAIEVNGDEHYLLRYAGYGRRPYILLATLNKSKLTYNQFDWEGSRTMKVAHGYIIDNWDGLHTGDVIDVEFINGETQEPKLSIMREAEGLYAIK